MASTAIKELGWGETLRCWSASGYSHNIWKLSQNSSQKTPDSSSPPTTSPRPRGKAGHKPFSQKRKVGQDQKFMRIWACEAVLLTEEATKSLASRKYECPPASAFLTPSKTTPHYNASHTTSASHLHEILLVTCMSQVLHLVHNYYCHEHVEEKM